MRKREINQNQYANLTNDFFIRKIKKFDKNFNFNKDFYKNTFKKISIQTSIRVWIKKKLISFKVMMNINFHLKNQITPFEVCASITDLEFKRNILEIKKMFTKTE
ncbi:hypothetical protein [Spiroplasma sabaudiense]|uniref:hypothetical protein n=1 Tax=Spiroplasma sabaudiense TaxID=216944 RepID=UPI0011DCC366|nr:hypothetical protein [Spiroplasma sabaudiense]